ncbi:isoprenoid synthase domain-containing protein [Aspergillus parasiticus]|uniref:Isoprenoid synthase domain-containing protein n=1 Tax=Aspergillus parasiticus TaxID=5067 RepID=A0A5N6DJC0_ASPPA|nr:isoprenoid synthase domain-containing protein [Aspergillus parasiticus]
MIMSSNTTWDTISAFDVPEHFSRFPAGIAHNSTEVVDALNKVIDASCAPGSKEEKKARTRHLTAGNEPFAICHCTAFPDRLVVLSSIIELAWINDDVTEELEHKEACIKHDILIDAMDPEKLANAAIGTFNSLETLFGLHVQKASAMDPEAAGKMVEVLTNYLKTFDSSDEEFVSMERYNPYRVANSGYWISSYFIRWGMGLVLSDVEYELLRDFDFSLGVILGLTNDYFSWNVEKNQKTDRVRNAVKVLMNEYNVSDTVAKPLLKGLIIDEEEKACRLKQKLLETPDTLSPAVLQYIEAIELYVGGSCYWHATAPRYKM